MGIFIKFTDDPECNWCGLPVYECTCGKGVNISQGEKVDGRIITDPSMKVNFFVKRETNGELIGVYLDGRNDGEECVWKGEYLEIKEQ